MSLTRFPLSIPGLVLALVLCFAPGAYGQDVVINSPVAWDAFGNSLTPDGITDPSDPTPNADNNSVTVNSGGSVNGAAIGGQAISSTLSATAVGNSVTVNSGGSVGIAGGGYAFGATASTTIGNSVTVNSGGSVNGVAIGGLASSSMSSATTTAIGNSVTISDGGTVGGNVIGGFAEIASGGTATATDNTVNIYGSPNLTTSGIYGGFLSGTAITSDIFSGNTLNMRTSGLQVASLQNFEFLNFSLPSTVTAGSTILTVTGTANLTGSGLATGRSSTVKLGLEGAAPSLQAGDSVTLIRAGTLTGAPANTTATAMQGVTRIYEFSLQTTSTLLTATLTKAGGNPQAEALPEGNLAGLALVSQGADLIAGAGMREAAQAARAGNESGIGYGIFGTLSGGWLRYNTGSHVDVSSLSLMTGLSYGAELKPGRLTLGAFFEYGTGSYDTYNSFSRAASVHGDGDMYYLGGGILGRMDFMNTGPGHFYAEASGRAGSVHNEYSSGDLRDSAGRKADYDASSAYYGLHLGTGYLWNINEKASLDLYGKYFWTRQEGDSVTLPTDDHVRFKDVDSHRTRAGARFTYAVNEYISPYVGAAWEYEFGGKARASSDGIAIGSPSLRGDTGIGELGLTLKPSATMPLSFDLGVQGYAGEREGVTGSLQAKFEF